MQYMVETVGTRVVPIIRLAIIYQPKISVWAIGNITKCILMAKIWHLFDNGDKIDCKIVGLKIWAKLYIRSTIGISRYLPFIISYWNIGWIPFWYIASSSIQYGHKPSYCMIHVAERSIMSIYLS